MLSLLSKVVNHFYADTNNSTLFDDLIEWIKELQLVLSPQPLFAPV